MLGKAFSRPFIPRITAVPTWVRYLTLLKRAIATPKLQMVKVYEKTLVQGI
jgi:hypothetical protein